MPQGLGEHPHQANPFLGNVVLPDLVFVVTKVMDAYPKLIDPYPISRP